MVKVKRDIIFGMLVCQFLLVIFNHFLLLYSLKISIGNTPNFSGVIPWALSKGRIWKVNGHRVGKHLLEKTKFTGMKQGISRC